MIGMRLQIYGSGWVMTKHPTSEWEWEDDAEVAFNEWFNGDYGSPYSLRSEWFLGDVKIGDEKTREDMMRRWVHSAFLSGYNVGRLNQHHKNLDKIYDKIEQHIEETDELLKEVDEYLEK